MQTQAAQQSVQPQAPQQLSQMHSVQVNILIISSIKNAKTLSQSYELIEQCSIEQLEETNEFEMI